MNSCEGPRTTVAVTVNTTAAPTGAASQSLSSSSTVSSIVVIGTNVIWYTSSANAAAGINPLPNTTLLTNATYYGTQTVNGCASVTSLAVTVSTLANQDFDLTKFNYYPNPVIDLLYISFAQEITSIKLFNMIGQQLLDKVVNATNVEVDMSNYSSGSYFIKVTSGNYNKTVRVIKK